jgi:hypothetical protein
MDILDVVTKIDLELLKLQAGTIENLINERSEDVKGLEDQESIDRYLEDIDHLTGLLELIDNIVISLERLEG